MRKFLAVFLTAFLATMFIGVGTAQATAPTGHKVDVCHATSGLGELKNGYNLINVDIASAGYPDSEGNNNHASHDGTQGNKAGPDIIGAYEYQPVDKDGNPVGDLFVFEGYNLEYVFEDGTTGAEFYDNGCNLNTPPDPKVIKTQVSVDFFDPTCREPRATFLSEFDPSLVWAKSVGKAEPGKTITISFAPKRDDIKITTETVFTHTFGEVPENCNPDVINVKQVKTTCDGVYARNVEITTAADGTITKNPSKWHFVSELTKAQKDKLDCKVPTDRPEKNEPKQPELPHTGASLGLALLGGTLVASGAGILFGRRFLTSN